jgi:hypothetical protein
MAGLGVGVAGWELIEVFSATCWTALLRDEVPAPHQTELLHDEVPAPDRHRAAAQ